MNEYLFEIGQAVTFPHSAHTTGGVIADRRVAEDGANRYIVRADAGFEVDYDESALYADKQTRAAVKAHATLTVRRQ